MMKLIIIQFIFFKIILKFLFAIHNFQLISLAIQRCRLSGDPCRLSVIIRQILFSSFRTQISISDTGVGSCLKEFQDLKLCFNGSAVWGLGDPDLFQYNLNLKESVPNKRLTKLPSMPKKKAIFSGTEVSMSTAEDMGVLLQDMTTFLRKIHILKIHNIAMELVAVCSDQQRLQHENVVLVTELTLPSPDSSILQQLTSGLEDYVCNHRNGLIKKCLSCFSSGENPKIGNGQACKKKHGNDVLAVEVVIVVSHSELSDPSNLSCLKAFEPKTEVLYFKDFSPCSVPQSALKAIKSVKWNNYGLTLKNIDDEGSSPSLEWENLPLNTHIDIALHSYNKQVTMPPLRQRNQLETKLAKDAISLALNDLKEMYTGALLSDHALKIHSYAPDLARSIAGLILSSDDQNFQGECFSLLGMPMANIEGHSLEKCIQDKIISAIDMNDRKPPSSRCRPAAPFLFGDDHVQESEYMCDEYDEGEEDDCVLMDY
ncbi:type 2 DNA topoisomerase 6 subunit B-like isoform X2 [Amaranthus tricolor]|uniref:type 2 DNA topoisomerase 6 subunit B-like isoform X2 n=1 Tax=Amaranthus tricolor TaxID=29722 RepID=UPI002585EF0C|nr:type 2 DNA topoisomerase 6 subunit B-like isoform X2 [Amaranthus tricolor]